MAYSYNKNSFTILGCSSSDDEENNDYDIEINNNMKNNNLNNNNNKNNETKNRDKLNINQNTEKIKLKNEDDIIKLGKLEKKNILFKDLFKKDISIEKNNYNSNYDIFNLDSNFNCKKATEDNNKKILCYNILNKGLCSYGKKCVYAHSLKEQNINENILNAYTIIKSNDDLSHINLFKNKKLYNSLLHLTRVCSLCLKGTCPGGYNCKYGTFSKKHQICKNNLIYGCCSESENCNLIHLTDRNLIPYNIMKKKFK